MTDALLDVSPELEASGPDPYLQPAYLLAVADATGQRAVEVRCYGRGWSLRYALLLQPHGDRWLARTPDYGGPVLTATDPAAAAPLARAGVDRVLVEHGVVSELSQASPWLPHADQLGAAWSWRAVKPVALLSLPLEPARLSHGRRADLRAWHQPAEHRLFAKEDAGAFAMRYGEAMDRLGASARWRFGVDYFAALAGTGLVHHVDTGDDRSGAAALFLLGPSRASYLFSVRWGKPTGASTQVLWHAAETLHKYGVTEVLLGGGATDAPDDPLLAFKRSWGGRETMHLVGARCFDEDAQRKAEDDGARPLPEGWVRA